MVWLGCVTNDASAVGVVSSLDRLPATLCLAQDRFRLTVAWSAGGKSGTGHAHTLTEDTGYFWFFDPANIEIVVKVLDGRPVNGSFWVFYGGLSNERDISICSGRAVSEALRRSGLRVDEIDIKEDPLSMLGDVPCDAAFIALHGKGGEDGTIQRVLERLGIPYTGSGPTACRRAFFKDAAKKTFRAIGC